MDNTVNIYYRTAKYEMNLMICKWHHNLTTFHSPDMITWPQITIENVRFAAPRYSTIAHSYFTTDKKLQLINFKTITQEKLAF